jgi:hypothetical protein
MDSTLEDAVDVATLERRRERAKRRRRWGWSVTGSLALGTLALCGGGYFAFDSFDRRQGELAVERVRNAGDPLTPEEKHASYPTSPAIEKATGHWLRAFAAAKEAYATPAANSLPYVGPATNVPTLDERGYYDASSVAAYRPILDGPFATALREAHHAREAGGTAHYPFDIETDYRRYFDEIGDVRAIGNLFALEMQLRAGEGDFEGAVDSVLGILAAGDSLQHEPWQMALLVRVAILGVASSHALELAHRGDLNDDQLHRLQEAFAEQDLLPQTLRTIRGEQYLFLRTFHRAAPQDPNVTRIRSFPFRGADQAKGVELIQSYLAEAELGFPAALAASERVAAQLEELDGSYWGRSRYTMTVYFVNNPAMTLNAVLRTQTDASVAAAYAASRRYRLAHGEWPASLDRLTPQYAASAPNDPSVDAPLEYEAESDVVRFRTRIYRESVNQVDVWFLDDLGRHVFDAAQPAYAGGR